MSDDDDDEEVDVDVGEVLALIEGMTEEELKESLREMELETDGSTEELRARLRAAYDEDDDDGELDPEQMREIVDGMDEPDLREAAEELGLEVAADATVDALRAAVQAAYAPDEGEGGAAEEAAAAEEGEDDDDEDMTTEQMLQMVAEMSAEEVAETFAEGELTVEGEATTEAMRAALAAAYSDDVEAEDAQGEAAEVAEAAPAQPPAAAEAQAADAGSAANTAGDGGDDDDEDFSTEQMIQVIDEMNDEQLAETFAEMNLQGGTTPNEMRALLKEQYGVKAHDPDLEAGLKALEALTNSTEHRRNEVSSEISKSYAEARRWLKRKERRMLVQTDEQVAEKLKRLNHHRVALGSTSKHLAGQTTPEEMAMLRKMSTLCTEAPIALSVNLQERESIVAFGQLEQSTSASLGPLLASVVSEQRTPLINASLALVVKSEDVPSEFNVSAATVRALVVALIATEELPEVLVENAVLSFSTFAGLGDEFREAVGANGGIELIMGWLTLGSADGQLSTNDKIVQGVCSALAALCSLESNAQAVKKLKKLKLVVDMLRDTHGDEGRLDVAVTLLARLSRTLPPQETKHETKKSSVSMETNSNAKKGSQKFSANVAAKTSIPATLGSFAEGDEEEEEEEPEEVEDPSIVPDLIEAGAVAAVLSAMKEVQSAGFCSQACRLLYFVGLDNQYMQSMVDGDVYNVLHACILEQSSRAAVESIAAVLLQHLQSAQLKTAAADFWCGQCLNAMQRQMAIFKSSISTQKLFFAIVAALSTSDENKAMMRTTHIIARTVMTMAMHSEDSGVQEQGCFALCAVCRGSEANRDFLSKHLDEFDAMAVIASALRRFADVPEVIEAGCSAVWSIAVRNVKMKQLAAERGVLRFLPSLVLQYGDERPLQRLPHIFNAINNLCVNHAPNQLAVGDTDLLKVILTTISKVKSDKVSVYMGCSACLAMVCGSLSNTRHFVSHGGVELCEALLAAPVARSTNVQTVVKSLLIEVEGLEKHKVDKKRGVGRRMSTGGRKSRLEEAEAEDSIGDYLDPEETRTVVKQTLGTVRHDKKKDAARELIVLRKHSLDFYPDPDGPKRKTTNALDSLQLPLLLSADVVDHDGAKQISLRRKDKPKEEILIELASDAELKEWKDLLTSLMPGMTGLLSATDGAEMLQRYVSWQNGCWTVWGAKHYKIKRMFHVGKLKESAVDEAVASGNTFSIHETVKGNWYRYVAEDADKAKEWSEFVATHIKEHTEKAAAAEAARIASMAASERMAQIRIERIRAMENAAKFRAENEARVRKEEDDEDQRLDDAEIAAEQERLQAEQAEQHKEAQELQQQKTDLRARRARRRKDAAFLKHDLEKLRAELAEVQGRVDVQKASNQEVSDKLEADMRANQVVLDEVTELTKEFHSLKGDVPSDLLDLVATGAIAARRKALQAKVDATAADDDLGAMMVAQTTKNSRAANRMN